MKVALDTNILVYAHGIGDDARVSMALSLLAGIRDRMVLPTQVIGELFNVLVRKARINKAEVVATITMLESAAEIVAASPRTFIQAVRLATDHHFQIWDAVIVQTARDAGCTILLSEDMQHGFVWSGLTIVNPWSASHHPLLAAALAGR